LLAGSASSIRSHAAHYDNAVVYWNEVAVNAILFAEPRRAEVGQLLRR
jgi:hypothetical protein